MRNRRCLIRRRRQPPFDSVEYVLQGVRSHTFAERPPLGQLLSVGLAGHVVLILSDQLLAAQVANPSKITAVLLVHVTMRFGDERRIWRRQLIPLLMLLRRLLLLLLLRRLPYGLLLRRRLLLLQCRMKPNLLPHLIAAARDD